MPASIRSWRPALVLGVNIPELDSIAVVRVLAADPNFSGMPILMLAACAQAAAVQTDLQAGATIAMVQPFAPSNLVASATDLLGRR